MNRYYRRLLPLLLLLGVWSLAPEIAYADNCSSLNDCYYTLRAALAAAVGLGVFAALMAIGMDLGTLTGNLKKKLKGTTGPGGAESIGAGEADVWERALGVVSVEGLVSGSGTATATSAGAPAGKSPGAQASSAPRQAAGPEESMAKEGPQSRTSEQGAARGDRTTDPARELTSDGGEGRLAGQAGGARPAVGEGPAGAGSVAERAEDATQMAGGEGQAEQAKQVPRAATRASEQGQPPADAPAMEERMSQTAPQGTAGGERARMTQDAPAGDRTTDQLRSGSEAEGAPAGRSGEWSGEVGAGTGGTVDGGDVVDRAQDVAEAFDHTESMVQAGKRAQASAQIEAPGRTGAPAQADASAKTDASSVEDVSRGAAQQSAKEVRPTVGTESADKAHQASDQGSPPTGEPASAESGKLVEARPPVTEPSDARVAPNLGVAKDLLRTYGELARVPGARLLLQQVALNATWVARGAAAHMGIARALRQRGNSAVQLGDLIEGRQGADIVLQDGAIVEAKNYYWAAPYFQEDDNVTETTRRLVRQIELLRRRYSQQEVQLAFSDLRGAPSQLRFVLQSIGVQVIQVADAVPPRLQDVVDAQFVARLDGATGVDYWQALLSAGWTETSAPVEQRVRSAVGHDPGSAYLALAVCAFDAECIYETNALGESYTALLQLLARGSQGALRPANVVERVQGSSLHIAFEHDGRTYRREVSAESDYFDLAVLEAINEAIADSGEERCFAALPTPDQMIYLTFMSSEARRRLEEAGLIPAMPD